MTAEGKKDQSTQGDAKPAGHLLAQSAHADEKQWQRRKHARLRPADEEHHEPREHPDAGAKDRRSIRQAALPKKKIPKCRCEKESERTAECPGGRERQQATQESRGMKRRRLAGSEQDIAST